MDSLRNTARDGWTIHLQQKYVSSTRNTSLYFFPAAPTERKPRPSSARRCQEKVRGQRWGYHQACCPGQRSRHRGETPRARSSPGGRTGPTAWRIIPARRGAERTSIGEDVSEPSFNIVTQLCVFTARLQLSPAHLTYPFIDSPSPSPL